MIQKAIGALFVFLLAPAGLGFLAVPGKRTVRRFFSVYLAGFLMELALFQLIAVPIILQKGFAFPTLVTWFTVALLVFMAAGFFLYLKSLGKILSGILSTVFKSLVILCKKPLRYLCGVTVLRKRSKKSEKDLADSEQNGV